MCCRCFCCCLQVLRSGKVRTMDAVDIVPGDVLMVRLGDIVPADIKLLGDEHAGEEGDVPMQVSEQRRRQFRVCTDTAQHGLHHCLDCSPSACVVFCVLGVGVGVDGGGGVWGCLCVWGRGCCIA